MAKDRVKLAYGEMIGYCTPRSVAAWERNGWTVVDDGSSEAEQKEPGEQDGGESLMDVFESVQDSDDEKE